MAGFKKEIIEAAIYGFEAQKQRIDAQITELRGMLEGSTETPATTAKRGRVPLAGKQLQRPNANDGLQRKVKLYLRPQRRRSGG